MRSVEDKEISTSSSINFEFHKGGGSTTRAPSSNNHHRAALGKNKATPSKWDDAQKWLVGLSRDKNSCNKSSKPRNSNADDTRLIAPVPHQENGYSSGEDEMRKGENDIIPGSISYPYEVETKNVDCEESYWRSNKTPMVVDTSSMGVRSVCVRDMGTEMTPIASQEPSRTATPIRATTPVRRSPIASGASTPIRCPQHHHLTDPHATAIENAATRGCNADAEDASSGNRMVEGNIDNNGNTELAKKMNPLETRAMAWDEAERAKYMARFKREEVKIQAWENHEKRKAEMEMKKMEVKAERLKARAQEKYTNKLAATRRIAEEKRANAEAKLNEKAVKTSEKADYIRRTGHLPSTLFKLPSICW